jgi:hypothetical protein
MMASGEFGVLTFSESFFKSWHLLGLGEPQNASHADLFAMAFKIESPNSGEMSLFFETQKYGFVDTSVSISTLFIVGIVYSVLQIRKRINPKVPSTREAVGVEQQLKDK